MVAGKKVGKWGLSWVIVGIIVMFSGTRQHSRKHKTNTTTIKK